MKTLTCRNLSQRWMNRLPLVHPVIRALIWSVILQTAATPLLAAVEDVRSAFHAAKKDFDQKKFAPARRQFIAIIKKYPDHEPSLIYLGKISFLEKNYIQANQYFRRVNPLGQDPDTLYEMGLVFVNRGRYREGIAALQRVPQGHQYYDLANYYSGLAALRMKQHAQARTYFKDATVLPDSLAEQRRVYLDHINKIMTMREQAKLKEDLVDEKKRLEAKTEETKPEAPLRPAQSQDGRKASKDRLAEASEALFGPEAGEGRPGRREIYDFEKTTNVFIARDHQDIRYEVGRLQTYEADIAGIQVRNGPDHRFDGTADGRSARLALDIDLRADQQVRRGQQERLVVFEDNADLEYYVSDDPSKKREQYGRVNLRPLVEWPVLDAVTLGLHGQYSYVFPNFDKSRGAGTRGGGIRAKGWVNAFELTGGFDFKEGLDADGRRFFNAYETFSEGRWHLDSSLSLAIDFSYRGFEYFQADLDGPDQLLGVHLSGVWLLPLGFEVGGSIGVSRYDHYIYHGVSRQKEIAADGVNYDGRAYLQAKPLRFTAFEAEYVFSDTYWEYKTDVQDDRVEFIANVPVTVSQFAVKGMFVLDF